MTCITQQNRAKQIRKMPLMLKKTLFLSLISASICIINSNIALCADFSPIKTINPNEGQYQGAITIDLENQSGAPTTIQLTPNDSFYHFANATDKFVQCNVRASWSDFKSLITNSDSNDFFYLAMANKMADLGLFDLASLAAGKIKDKDITALSIGDMKRYYFPKKKLKTEDEMFLAEIYSNIMYNDQSSESTNELLKNEALLSNSDYANYLVALGSYKSNFYSRANKYIDLAILQNPTNLNYKKLKAEIVADNNKPAEAVKIVNELKKQSLYSFEYEKKVDSLEQYILYKTKTETWEKNYHLGYYYFIENDNSKAIKALQTAISSTKKKNNQGKINGLMSEIYLNMNEFEKASDSAKKSYKINSNNPMALLTLGDLSYKNKNFKQALKYYKQASSQDKLSYTPMIKEAQTYQQLNNIKKAKEIYQKILKTRFDSWEAYYNTALLDKDKETIYIKKALAVNPLFKDGWIQLAKTEIDKSNYYIAGKYLSNAYYIDENDFRYYYYQGLVCKNTGEFAQAEYNFKKCLKLNPKCTEARQEISPATDI